MWIRVVRLLRIIFARTVRGWTRIVWTFRILFACRVSVLSGGAGLALFWMAVPAQNLLADTSWARSTAWAWNLATGLGFWGLFFAAMILLWAFPVHYGARRTLDRDDWIIPYRLRAGLLAEARRTIYAQTRSRHRRLIVGVPRWLAMLPFAAIALGLLKAVLAEWGAVALPIGRYTIAQLAGLSIVDLVTAIGFFIFLVRRESIVDGLTASPRGERLIRLFEKASLLVTLAIFVLTYAAPLTVAGWIPRALLVPPLFGSLVLVLSALQRRANHYGVPFLAIAIVSARLITALNGHFDDLRVLTAAPKPEQIAFADAVARWKKANGCAEGSKCPPALIIAIDGGASRAAFTAATFIGELLDHMPPPRSGESTSPGRRIFAVSGVSGGALGAVMLQAALVDAESQPAKRTPCKAADPTWYDFRRHLSLRDEPSNWRNCLQALTSGDFLSPVIMGLGFRDLFAPASYVVGGASLIEDRAALLEESWERHYEHVMGTGPRCNRGGGLCRGFARLNAFYAAPGHELSWVPLLLLNGTSVKTGRRIIASDLASVWFGQDGNPLGLFPEAYDLFEAMSSPCAANLSYSSEQRQFDEQNDVNERVDVKEEREFHEQRCLTGKPIDAPDIRMSTAALASARFPVISPPGAFAIEPGGFGDRIVDGGYFENSGDTTALDVAEALKRQEPPIEAMLLSISNDPEQQPENVAIPPRPSFTPLMSKADADIATRLFGLWTAPLETILQTREGHGAEAKNLATVELARGSNFFKLGVSAIIDVPVTGPASPDDADCVSLWRHGPLEMTIVSMSWWLSAAVQADLDAQRCTSSNRSSLHDLLRRLTWPYIADTDATR